MDFFLISPLYQTLDMPSDIQQGFLATQKMGVAARLTSLLGQTSYAEGLCEQSMYNYIKYSFT